MIWSFDGNQPYEGPNTIAPIGFYKATNYDSDFYALADIASVNMMTSQVDYADDAWPCEDPRER